jgi:hypothetical protein
MTPAEPHSVSQLAYFNVSQPPLASVRLMQQGQPR